MHGRNELEETMQRKQGIAGTEARFDRFHVGNIVCTALSDGGILVHRPAPPRKEGDPPVDAAAAAPAPLVIPLSCLVVELPQKLTVLIDAGFGLTPEVLEKPMSSAGRLQESLKAAGYGVDDIDVVLISHFDIDHVAGLYDQNGEQIFQNAQYYASAEAVEFWSREKIDLDAFPGLPWIKKERLHVSAHVLKAGGARLKTFKVGEDVLPGVLAMDLPGHAPGQVGFLLSSEGENLLYTADAITNAVVSIETPEVFNIMDLDPETAVRVRKQLLSSISEAGWRSFSPHFTWPSWGRVQKQGDRHVWKAGE